jgi:hypothetical protein
MKKHRRSRSRGAVVVLVGRSVSAAVPFLSSIGKNCKRAVVVASDPDGCKSMETIIPAQYIFSTMDEEPLNRIVDTQRYLAVRKKPSSLLLIVQSPTAKNGFLTRSLVDQLWFLKSARDAGATVCLLADADAVIEPALVDAVNQNLIDGWLVEPTMAIRPTTDDQPSLSGIGIAVGCLSFPTDDGGRWKPAVVRTARRAAAFGCWIGIRRSKTKTAAIDDRLYLARPPRQVVPVGDDLYRGLIVGDPTISGTEHPFPLAEPACWRKLLLFRGCCSRPKIA